MRERAHRNPCLGVQLQRVALIVTHFRNPYSSLNSRHDVETILSRPLRIRGVAERSTIHERVRELLTLVGLGDHYLQRLPAALSGGERQRVAIARALALEPKLLVLDEPTSALDMSVQAQIINLLVELKARLQLTYLLISHDLNLVEYVCDRTLVMYAGKAAELGASTRLYRQPRHPYTQALLTSVLVPGVKKAAVRPLAGEVPAAWDPPPGCRFHPRCPIADRICSTVMPEWEALDTTHYVACHMAGE